MNKQRANWSLYYRSDSLQSCTELSEMVSTNRPRCPSWCMHRVRLSEASGLKGEGLSLTLVNCLVVVAGLIRDSMFVGILPHSSMVSSVTGARSSTVNHMLDRDVSRWPPSSTLDVDTVYTKEQSLSCCENWFTPAGILPQLLCITFYKKCSGSPVIYFQQFYQRGTVPHSALLLGANIKLKFYIWDYAPRQFSAARLYQSMFMMISRFWIFEVKMRPSLMHLYTAIYLEPADSLVSMVETGQLAWFSVTFISNISLISKGNLNFCQYDVNQGN